MFLQNDGVRTVKLVNLRGLFLAFIDDEHKGAFATEEEAFAAVEPTLLKRAAVKVGRELGTAAATWYEVSGEEQARAVLAGILDGDPEVLDTIPHLDLSGQWADGPTPKAILEQVYDEAGVEFPDNEGAYGPNDDVANELIDEVEGAYYEATEFEVVRAARIQAGIED